MLFIHILSDVKETAMAVLGMFAGGDNDYQDSIFSLESNTLSGSAAESAYGDFAAPQPQ